jgi:ribose transport system substrate-binding protein
MLIKQLRRFVKSSIFLLIFAFSAVITGISSTAFAAEKIIAVSFPNYSKQGSVITTLEQAKARGAELGYKVILTDPGTDLNKQVNTIKTWIQQKVPAIIAVTLNPDMFESIAKEARDAGIAWITYAGALQNQDATVGFVHYENGFTLGEYAGRWINENLGDEARVVLFGYEKGDWGQRRANGIRDGLRSQVPNANIVAEQDAISPSEGLNTMRTILQAHPDVNVLLSIEDPSAEGAYKAWVNSGRDAHDPKAFFGGMDGTPEALKLLRAGGTVYRASMAIPLTALGNAMAELADDIINGINQGDRMVPMELVTQKSPSAQKYLDEQGVTD